MPPWKTVRQAERGLPPEQLRRRPLESVPVVARLRRVLAVHEPERLRRR